MISILMKMRKPSTKISDSLEIALSDLGRYQALPFWSGFSVWERIAEKICQIPIFWTIKTFGCIWFLEKHDSEIITILSTTTANPDFRLGSRLSANRLFRQIEIFGESTFSTNHDFRLFRQIKIFDKSAISINRESWRIEIFGLSTISIVDFSGNQNFQGS